MCVLYLETKLTNKMSCDALCVCFCYLLVSDYCKEFPSLNPDLFHRRLRGSIVHYCELHPLVCAHNSYGLNGTRFSFKVDGHNPLELSLRSVFCFQPIGDLMTRKGLFDSILLGCIPIVFDPLTAEVMYTWHWEEDFWKQVRLTYSILSILMYVSI